MLLRKHLVGARITEISQPENERSLTIDLNAPGMFGEGEKRKLIVELFGRTANIILTDGDGVITDCLYRIGGVDEKRAVLPGMIYRLPEAQEKRNILELNDTELENIIDSADGDVLFDKWLIRNFYGFSPLTAREICLRVSGDVSAPMYKIDREKATFQLNWLSNLIKSGEMKPCLVSDANGVPFEFSYIPITQYGADYRLSEEGSFSELLEKFWGRKNEDERRRQRTNNLMKTVKNLRDRTERRLFNQREELAGAGDRERLRENGDIITSNLHLMKKGMTVLRAFDYYSEDGGEQEIKLDPLKTPQQNAAKYYKDYSRAKSAEIHLTEQIERGQAELDYLESVIEELQRAETARDVAEIRAELVDTGVIKEQNSKKREKRTVEGPMRFKSDTGFVIRVGRNNTQNDVLTMKSSSKTDMWLHAQKIHGSHVIISLSGETPDEVTLNQAASLAAYYSQARESSKVPVDYTLVKYVKKPNGAKPGMVIYTDYKTIVVQPDGGLAERLKG
jgi:predicted ribosome quality control (RQC) complex YloA/Tae2 family protein